MLATIAASYIQSYADVISRVTGIDVEIVDSRMVRIAGTGIYGEGVGGSLAHAGEVYKEVMRTRETVLIESSRSHAICRKCPDRVHCREELSVSTPIVDGETVIGVIGLVCFNAEERRRVLDSRDSFMAFIALLAEALAHKVQDLRRLDRASGLLELMLQIVDVHEQGVMVFDADGRPTFVSKPARELLEVTDGVQLCLADIRRTGDSLSGYEEFEVTLPGGNRLPLMGQMVVGHSGSSERVVVFAFDLPTRLARRVGDLSSGGGETGLDGLVGRSAALEAVKEKAAKVSKSTSTLLISGESGTGKELLARAIHQAGPRRDFPFVAINCGAIPDTLLESELFGYVGGAFTGASSKGRMGKFELAQGGVIFLDEISTMPLYLQVKLLRVLQERNITRLGSNRVVDVDVRIIAASNDDLWACARQHTFREDLYYRLNVIQLTMPPLRERTGDVPILADFFLKKYCVLFQKRKPSLPKSLLRVLEKYDWPGNVRELEHVMEYAVNMVPDGEALQLDCLPVRFRQSAPPVQASPRMLDGDGMPEGAGTVEGIGEKTGENTVAILGQTAGQHPEARIGLTAVEPLHRLEERAIRNALAVYGESTQGKRLAAQALGLSVATLYRKIASFSK